jgi:hypothetical protein
MFATPFVFEHPQLLVGSIVNLFLIYIALNFQKSQLIPSIFIPSIAVILRGSLLGSVTPFLLFLMPIIWLGNALFIIVIRYLAIEKKSLILNLILSALVKALLLFSFTWLIVKTLSLPSILLIAMGITQLVTALIGGSVYYLLNRIGK